MNDSFEPNAPPTASYGRDIEELEVKLLIQALRERYGYDFSEYARASLVRRFWKTAQSQELETLGALLNQVLHDREVANQVLRDVSVHVTAMFRDPEYYRTFRNEIIPQLETYPLIRVWVAGCSSGEEAYSVAIALHEAGILKKSRVYATDVSHSLLKRAQSGVFPLRCMQEYTANYQQAGGKREFSEYYTAQYENALFRSELSENMVFSQHNLVSDSSFNEFHAIFCRNVMIYFDRKLQTRVHSLFHNSLVRLGYLCLGTRENLTASPHLGDYSGEVGGARIFRRLR